MIRQGSTYADNYSTRGGQMFPVTMILQADATEFTKLGSQSFSDLTANKGCKPWLYWVG